MPYEDIIVLVIPVVVFLGSMIGVRLLGLIRHFGRQAIGLSWLIWAGITAWFFYAASTASGWDGLGYAIGILFICAPMGLGVLIGGIWGWPKREITQPV